METIEADVVDTATDHWAFQFPETKAVFDEVTQQAQEIVESLGFIRPGCGGTCRE